ncbi:hypothetical protein KI387_008092, partial [Taxus chinensis]
RGKGTPMKQSRHTQRREVTQNLKPLGTTVCFLPLLRRSVGVEVVSEHTTIEMTGTDGPGILSEVFVVLTDLGYNVVEAEVWTYNTRVACILYVTDKAT